jgi:predicted DNA-binding transcriptional regulator YafY
MIIHPYPGNEIEFIYKNCKGKISAKKVSIGNIFFGMVVHYTDPQWLMSAFDLDNKEWRHFSLKNMSNVAPLNGNK